MKPLAPYALVILGCGLAGAQVEDEIPVGIEAVTGLRSGVVYRGIELADAALDFQIESEIALSDNLFLSVGAWHVAESSGDFSSTEVFSRLTREWTQWSVSALFSYRDFDSDLVDSGLEGGVDFRWSQSRDFSLSALVSYDTGADSALISLSADYSRPLSEKAYWQINGQATAADEFYGESGLVELRSRLSLTYNVNSQVSLTPFFTATASAATSESSLVAGVWFAVSF